MTTKTIVFLGPSLSLPEARSILPDALYMPPVRCGDVLLSLQQQPEIIGIIDGYFEQIGAVWHKEILFALNKGVKVYGAASMGALRAAEMCDFGMIGVGKVFSDYRDGILEDDDEVTVLHRPRQSNYEIIGDALVNIRATLQKAVEENIITSYQKNQLITHAKSQFYKARKLNESIKWYAEYVSQDEITPLQNWLTAGHFVDQKKIDAIGLLKVMHDADAHTNNNPCGFNNTLLLQQLADCCSCESSSDMSGQLQNKNELQDGMRYVGLLAYLLKTCKRLSHSYNGNLNHFIFNINIKTAADIVEYTHQLLHENPELLMFFYSLIALFQPKTIENINKIKHCDLNLLSCLDINVDKSLRVLCIAAIVLFAVNEIMQQHEVYLSQSKQKEYIQKAKKNIYKQSPLFFEKTNHLKIDAYALATTYFILNDVVSNRIDSFITGDTRLLILDLHSEANQIFDII